MTKLSLTYAWTEQVSFVDIIELLHLFDILI